MTLLELAKERFDDLTENEDQLFSEIQKTGVAVFHEKWENIDPSTADLPELRAECVAWLLTDRKAGELITHRGVTVVGAWLTGKLDASFAQFPWQLGMIRCHVPDGMTLRNATLGLLGLSGSDVGGLNADGMQVSGGVFLDNGFTAHGEVRLLGSSIGGDLGCSGGEFRNAGGKALSADRMKVSGSVFLNNGFTAHGEVRLLGSSIGGNLTCRGGEFRNEGGYALNADRMKVSGSVFLDNGFTAQGEVRLLGSSIGGGLSCSGGEFINFGDKALSADGMEVSGSAFLKDGFTAHGEVRLLGSSIGGNLACRGGEFRNAGGNALSTEGIRVSGSVFLNVGFTAHGAVRLLGSSIGGNLACRGGVFNNGDGNALSADGMRVSGSVLLNKGFTAHGEVRLLGSSIGGQLTCSGGMFLNGAGMALNGESVIVADSVFLNEMKTDGQIKLGHSSLKKGLKVADNTWARDSSLSLRGVSAGTLSDTPSGWPAKRSLHLNGFTFGSFQDGATKDVSERLAWLDLQPDDDYRPQPYEQLAKVYDEAGHENRARAVRIARNDKLRWFIRHRKPWKLGHHYYREFLKVQGDDRFALAAKMLPDRLAAQVARFPRYSWRRGLWHGFLGWSVGYGYKPILMLVWMALFIAIGSCLFNYGYGHGAMTATQRSLFTGEVRGELLAGQAEWREALGGETIRQLMPDDYPHFHPVIYSLDTFLPLVDLQQENFWMPNSNFEKSVSCFDLNLFRVTGFPLRIYLTIHILMGWLLTTMAIAAFTGRLKRQPFTPPAWPPVRSRRGRGG